MAGSPNASPKAGSTSLHDVILQTWLSAFGSTKVSYLSGPITTGPLFSEWYSRIGHNLHGAEFSDSKRQHVIVPNSSNLIAEASRIRAFWPTAIVEPASFFIREWSQEQYLQLWSDFIEKHVDRILFLPNWESSVGCVTEFTRAVEHSKERVTLDGSPIALDRGIALVTAALEQANHAGGSAPEYIERMSAALRALQAYASPRAAVVGEVLQKDESLDVLADLINVAQFVSYRPKDGKPEQSYSRILGESPNIRFEGLADAAARLLARSVDGTVNVRSYAPNDAQSREFVYGLKSVDEAVRTVERLSNDGLWTIVNETIDIQDGGVSGVLWDDIIEYAPDDTPRAVEKEGTCSLPSGMGTRILEAVYGFSPSFALPKVGRLEFSLHPTPRGWRRGHTVGWEFSPGERKGVSPRLQWPNTFSRLIGDKAFGLLIAHELGLPVPRSVIVSRRVAPFTFGRRTGTNETWTRTAPLEQEPGRFSTVRGWLDPFKILAAEDPEHQHISSVIAQDGVRPIYSGASIVLSDEVIRVEGVAGPGDQFMLGDIPAGAVPEEVRKLVIEIHEKTAELGPVRFEWVYDGCTVWVVQFHRGQTDSTEDAVVGGEAHDWHSFDPALGLPALRTFINQLPSGTGILLTRRIGLTSHIADVIRKAHRPARFRN